MIKIDDPNCLPRYLHEIWNKILNLSTSTNYYKGVMISVMCDGYNYFTSIYIKKNTPKGKHIVPWFSLTCKSPNN